MTTVAAIVLAAGSATRMGAKVNKPYLTAAGRPLLWYSLTALRAAGITEIVVVARRDDFPMVDDDQVVVAEGGPTRTDSEMAGLAALTDSRAEMVMIHDAARPFLTTDLVHSLREAAAAGGAVPVMKPSPRLWTRDGGRLLPAPAGTMTAQTPQAFLTGPLREAYAKAGGAIGADTAEIMRRFGGTAIRAVPGDPLAFKITHTSDLNLVEDAARRWLAVVVP